MKKNFAILILAVMMVFAFSATAFAATPKVFVGGQKMVFDVPPTVQNGTTLVPMRAIFETLGATVDYSNGLITGTKGDTTIKLRINSKTATKNGQAITLAVPAKTINGRTMVPLRFIAESLDKNVDYDGQYQTISIYTPQLILNDKNLSITYRGVSEDWLGMKINLLIENKSNRDLCVQVRDFSIDNYMTDTIFSCDIAAGKKAYDDISLLDYEKNMNEIQFNFHVFSWEDYDFYYDSDIITVGL